MKAYIVKYALTKGIIEAEYDPEDSVKSSTYVPVIWAKPDGWDHYDIFFENEYALTIERAKFMADEMRQCKIAALKKQIAKFEGMRF